MPLGCYSFCRGAKGPPSCCLPFPRCHPNGPSLCVCDSFSVCRSKIAELSQWHGESQACVCVSVCALSHWGWSQLQEMDWHGRPRLGFWGEDERVPSHTLKNSLSLLYSSLFLLLDAPFISATNTCSRSTQTCIITQTNSHKHIQNLNIHHIDHQYLATTDAGLGISMLHLAMSAQ